MEEASNQAAAVTFGLPSRGQRSNGYSTVEATLDAVHDHDEAYSEGKFILVGSGNMAIPTPVSILARRCNKVFCVVYYFKM